jgi:hypothetical protein
MENHLPEKWLKKIEKKNYALLSGDLLEDLNMLPKEKRENAITIGLLENDDDVNLEKYRQNFDIVLTKQDARF